MIEGSLRALAAGEILDADYSRLFVEFCQGREAVGFDEFDLEEEDLKELTSVPPYRHSIVPLPSFEAEWAKVSAAMHGYATRQYLLRVAERISSSTQRQDHEIIFDLVRERQRLSAEHQTLENAHSEFVERGDYAGARIAKQNTMWNSRQIIYNEEDIEALKEGHGVFLRNLTERQWAVGYAAR